MFGEIEHNHNKKLQSMVRNGLVEIKHGTLAKMDIAHDDWCNLLHKKGYCNCNPDITIMPTEDYR